VDIERTVVLDTCPDELQTGALQFREAQKTLRVLGEDLLNRNPHQHSLVAANRLPMPLAMLRQALAIPKLDAKKVFARTNDGMTVSQAPD